MTFRMLASILRMWHGAPDEVSPMEAWDKACNEAHASLRRWAGQYAEASRAVGTNPKQAQISQFCVDMLRISSEAIGERLKEVSEGSTCKTS